MNEGLGHQNHNDDEATMKYPGNQSMGLRVRRALISFTVLHQWKQWPEMKYQKKIMI